MLLKRKSFKAIKEMPSRDFAESASRKIQVLCKEIENKNQSAVAKSIRALGVPVESQKLHHGIHKEAWRCSTAMVT